MHNCFNYVRAMILQLRGGRIYWDALEPVIKEMTPQQQEALLRVLQNSQQEGKDQARQQLRQSHFR